MAYFCHYSTWSSGYPDSWR